VSRRSRCLRRLASCPVSGGIVHLDPDYEGLVGIGLAMNDSGAGIQISANRAHRHLFIGPPFSLGHDPCAVATDINSGRNFGSWIVRAAQFHEHFQRDALFFSACWLRTHHRYSFGPGGPYANATSGAIRRNGTKGQSPASHPVPSLAPLLALPGEPITIRLPVSFAQTVHLGGISV